MITPGGIIQRIMREPSIHLEFMEADGDTPQWTEDRQSALFFTRYHDADVRAKELGGRPIFAVTVHQPDPAAPIVAADLLEPPAVRPHRLSKPRHRLAASYHNSI